MPTMTDTQIGNRNNWKVSIEGVKNPKTFTLAQLKKLGHRQWLQFYSVQEMVEVFLNIK